MSATWQLYIITILVFTGIDAMAVWALNIQFGVAGILNFAFIIFQAAGAYVASVLTLGPSSASGGFQRYILGARFPWPLPLVAAGIVGGILAVAVGLIALRPRRIDYQGMVLLTVSLIVTVVVTDYPALFNGSQGLAAVPKPMQNALHLNDLSYGWFYVALTAALVLLTYAIVRRLTHSPWGRQLRAIRENPAASQSIGMNIDGLRLQAFVVGGVLAAVSGAVFVQFLGAWSPAAWGTDETLFFFTAVVIGGVGNNTGVLIGAVIVFAVLFNGIEYLPIYTYTTVASALQSVALGLGFIAFVWFRPAGMLPERPERFGEPHRRQVHAFVRRGPSEARR